MCLLPMQGMSASAHTALGILTCAIVWWIVKVFPEFVTGLLMCAAFTVFCGVPTETVFSAFSGASWWLLLSAFGISVGVSESGLMKRVTLSVLKLFPASFTGQVTGLLVVGTLTAPFIPSMSAKAAIFAPLVKGICADLGYRDGSRHASGIFLAMLTGLRNPGPLFISASVLGYAFIGLLPDYIQERYSMLQWLVDAFPWFATVSVLNFSALLLVFRPKNEISISRDSLQTKLEAMGPMSGQEKYMLVLSLATIGMWISEGLHGIPSEITAVISLALVVVGKGCSAAALCANINWGSMLFLGIALSLSSVFSYLNIDKWIVDTLAPMLTGLVDKPCALMLAVALFTTVSRFVIVSELAFVNIFIAFTVPLAEQAGINPWVVCVAVYALVNPWFFMYQNPVYMAAHYAAGGTLEKASICTAYCVVYQLICMVGLVVSTFIWLRCGTFYIN